MPELMNQTSTTQIGVHDKFLAFLPKSKEPLFLQHYRDKERLKLLVTNPPTSRDEYWKYTRTAKILSRNFVQATESYKMDYSSFVLEGLDAYRLYFTDGVFDAKQSQEIHSDKVIICSTQNALKLYPKLIETHLGKSIQREKEFFTLLNNTLFQDGVFVHIAKGTVLEKPISIIKVGKEHNILNQCRNIFIFEEQSQGKIIKSENAILSEDAFINEHTEVFVGKNAHVSLDILQNENHKTDRIEGVSVLQQANSVFKINTITISGRLVRNNLDIRLDGQHCETYLNGIYSCLGNQHFDNHTFVDHKEPNCFSSELYKGIMDNQSVGVFNGKVLVRKDAQKTNAFQSNQNIVLSDKAGVFSKPELEIYADDVKCSHGSTTGQLDEDAVFYLQSRGISKEEARKMLVYAFLGEVLEKVEIEPLKNKIDKNLSERYDQSNNE